MSYLASTAEGRYLLKAEAAPILDYFNIDRNTVLGSVPLEVDYGGKKYLIYEGDYYIPYGVTRPDGLHFIYEPSSEEIDKYINPPPEPGPLDIQGTINSVIWVAGIGIAAYVGVELLKAFKK